MEKNMKKVPILILMVSPLGATPYIEYKNEAQFQYENYLGNSSYFRAGYKFDNNVYIEVGETQELGYKFNEGNWTFKGKWEFKNEDKSKLETEIRYSFK